jgi:hypothetical protein
MRTLILLAAIAAAAPAQAKWRFDENVDPITDVRRPIIVLDNSTGDAIVLKCDSHGLRQVYAQIIAHSYLGGSGARSTSRQITYRFDSLPPVNDSWTYDGRWAASGGTSLGGKFPEFIRGLSASSKVAFRAVTYDFDYVDMIFDSTGSDEAIRKVFADCGDQSLIAYQVPAVAPNAPPVTAQDAGTNGASNPTLRPDDTGTVRIKTPH